MAKFINFPMIYIFVIYNRLSSLIVIIFLIMTTAFSSSSRFANFRQKKGTTSQDNQPQFKLTLPENQEKTQKPSYQPSSSSFNNTRTSLRLLKGRIQKGKSTEKQPELKSGDVLTQQQPKFSMNDNQGDLKLVIHDSPQIQKKILLQQTQQKKPTQKRILIAKETPKQQTKVQEKKQAPIQTKNVQVKKHEQQYINPHDEKPIIKEQQIEESKEQQEQNENDLVICPEGCGRKFNRRALEKHAKACKLVFMSKRKQFNSEAKRIASKDQASINRQTKMKEKSNIGKTKTKGFDKTSDNWKAHSQDFRNAIKAIKKEDQEEEGGDEEGNEQAKLASAQCQYCEKKFAQVLLEKHLENCVKRKQKEEKQKKKVVKKK